MAARGVPVAERVFGEGTYLRPNFIQPYRCRNVLDRRRDDRQLADVGDPSGAVHERDGARRDRSQPRPNNDGCDPESCRDVLIERCTFDTGDDCIALKSGRNADGRRLNAPIENVVIRDCEMRDGHGGVVIGSEISGGARNIFAERCRMDSPRLDRALRFKTNAVRGGVIEHVSMRDVTRRPGRRSDRRRRLLLRGGRHGRLHAGAARRRGPQRHQPEEQVRVSAEGLRRGRRSRTCGSPTARFDGVESPDVLRGVRDLVLTNVRVNGSLRNERITRD